MAHQQAVPAPNHRRRAARSQTLFPDGEVRMVSGLRHRRQVSSPVSKVLQGGVLFLFFRRKKKNFSKNGLTKREKGGRIAKPRKKAADSRHRKTQKKVKKVQQKGLTKSRRCGRIGKSPRGAVQGSLKIEQQEISMKHSMCERKSRQFQKRIQL